MTKYGITEDGKNQILLEARKRAGLTIVEAAEKIGISYGSYINYELMMRYPSKEYQKKICDFYISIGIPLFEENVFSEKIRKQTKNYTPKQLCAKPKFTRLSDSDDEVLSMAGPETPETYTIENMIVEKTRRVLSTLTPREEKILKMRFGIDKDYDHPLKEVGQKFDVTRERIRQIEAKALRKLRHPSRSRKLRSFLED